MDELGFAGGSASFEAVGGSPMARILAMTMIQQENALNVQSMGQNDVAAQNVGQAASSAIGGRQ